MHPGQVGGRIFVYKKKLKLMNTQPDNNDVNPAKSGNSSEQTTKPFYRRGRVLGGIIVVTVGAVLLASRLGVGFPEWFFHWAMIPIVVGLYSGARHKFRSFGWLIPVAVGTVFLLHDFTDLALHHYLWPVIIIIVGISIMFKGRRRWDCRNDRWQRRSDRYTAM